MIFPSKLRPKRRKTGIHLSGSFLAGPKSDLAAGRRAPATIGGDREITNVIIGTDCLDEAKRQRAQRTTALIQVRETHNEIVLGGIRDSIADYPFPGTSTFQTLLRYMLFVPWLSQMLEELAAGSRQLAIEEANVLENRLANALKAFGERMAFVPSIFNRIARLQVE